MCGCYSSGCCHVRKRGINPYKGQEEMKMLVLLTAIRNIIFRRCKRRQGAAACWPPESTARVGGCHSCLFSCMCQKLPVAVVWTHGALNTVCLYGLVQGKIFTESWFGTTCMKLVGPLGARTLPHFKLVCTNHDFLPSGPHNYRNPQHGKKGEEKWVQACENMLLKITICWVT